MIKNEMWKYYQNVLYIKKQFKHLSNKNLSDFDKQNSSAVNNWYLTLKVTYP